MDCQQEDLREIYTIGHSNHTLEAFLDLLRRHCIEVLIDTRSAPFSRFAPQFNRQALRAAVSGQGIKYGFYGRELGGRPEGKGFYDTQGHVLYSEVAQSAQFVDGLERLRLGAETHRVALLCSEEDPNLCHRRLLVSQVLYEQGVGIVHIRGDGRLDSEEELREREAQRGAECQARLEEARRLAEHKTQIAEARRTAVRERHEKTTRLKTQHKQETETARLKKKCERQGEVERKVARRVQLLAERKMRKGASQQKAAQPELFNMEETASWKSLQSVSPKAPPATSLGD